MPVYPSIVIFIPPYFQVLLTIYLSYFYYYYIFDNHNCLCLLINQHGLLLTMNYTAYKLPHVLEHNRYAAASNTIFSLFVTTYLSHDCVVRERLSFVSYDYKNTCRTICRLITEHVMQNTRSQFESRKCSKLSNENVDQMLCIRQMHNGNY